MGIAAPAWRRVPSGFAEVLPWRLYQTGNWLRWTDEDCRARAATVRATHHVNLWREDPRLSAYLVSIHFPLPDGALNDEVVRGRLLELAHESSRVIEAGGCVVTACHAGRNRSGLVSALIMREVAHMTGSEALEHVRAARPRAVDNGHFEEFLRGLDVSTRIG